jgi:hypothetical protein
VPTLAPLICPTCKAELEAELDQLAFRCGQCGAGWHLDETPGQPLTLRPLTLRYSNALRGQTGRPFWTAGGMVRIGTRETYGTVFGGGGELAEATRFWSQPRRFFLPAFKVDLNTMLEIGRQALLQPPSLTEGPPAPHLPVTIPAHDIHGLARFVVISLEAERRDQLRQLGTSVELGEPELWVMP